VAFCWAGLLVADRLLVDLGSDRSVTVSVSPETGFPEVVSRSVLEWPLTGEDLEGLRWYLEDYLKAPFGVWEDRGPGIQARLDGWGEAVFGSVFGPDPARDAYQRARDRGLEVVFRSDAPGWLGLPWELMRDGAGPVALGAGGISRSLPVADAAQALEVPGGRLRVLMVICRPAGTSDVEYQMVARPLLERLEAVRGQVDLVVLRPPTFGALSETLKQAADAGEPFQVVHFDGHGKMPAWLVAGPAAAGVLPETPADADEAEEGMLAFEQPWWGAHLGAHQVAASQVARVLADARVPVVVLNACQSGAVGKELEASVATALLRAGCAAVVAMAYSVYAVAAAEFMTAFYESLFTGQTVGQAVTAGRRRLARRPGRPSPRGQMPLADWLVPVHYMRQDVSFPQARTARPADAPPLEQALDQLRETASAAEQADNPLGAAGGVFVGRDDLIYQLEAAARLQHVAVLTGPGGTGKTELAKGFARWLRSTGGIDDPQLAVWLSFEPGTASPGLDAVISAVGLEVFGTDFARLDPPARLDAVKRRLAQSRVLLIWDNFETVFSMPDPGAAAPPLDDAEREKIREFLAWVREHSRSMVVITSRSAEAWLGEVRRIAVGGLNRAEIAEYADFLLAPYPRARDRRAGRVFGELLEWLDGHPLSMRLTLPRLDRTEPGTLLDGLRGTRPLPGADLGEAGRLSSLPASIGYSFAHLTEDTARLLTAACLFHGVADADVLAAFCREPGVPERFAGASREDWGRALDEAVSVGLLTSLRAGRYRMHPALPAYLAGQWQAAEPDGYEASREAAETALAAASAALCGWLEGQVSAGNAGFAYQVLDLERRTLGVVLGRCLDHQEWGQAQAIARALTMHWDARGLYEEAAAWTSRVQDATALPGDAPPALDTPAGSLWQFITGAHADRQRKAGRPDQAAAANQQILDMLGAQPATRQRQADIAAACHNLGDCARDRGRLDEAEDWYRQSLAIEEDLGNRSGMAITYRQLGKTAQNRGRLDEAEDWYRQSLAIEEDLGNRPRMAVIYHELGNTAHMRGRLDEAEDWCRQSLAIEEELGDRPGMAASYHLLGMTAQNRGRLDEAEDWYRRVLAIEEALGDRPGMAGTYHQIGVTAQDQGRLDEAEDWYRQSLAIEEDLGNRPGMADSYFQLGITAYLRGRLDEAEDWYRQSLAIEEDLGNRPGMAADCYYRLGIIAQDQQQPHEALAWMIRCVTVSGQVPHTMTGPGPDHLARFARQLGMPALESAWRQVTGQALPQTVRGYITSYTPGAGDHQ
jgi:tetratricopeptide (TPR) repeat protein